MDWFAEERARLWALAYRKKPVLTIVVSVIAGVIGVVAAIQGAKQAE